MRPAQAQVDASPGFLRIRRVALRLFAKQGFAATGIRDITREADINVSVLYHHFPSKELILASLMESGLCLYGQIIEDALQLAQLPEEELLALAAVHVMIHVHDR
jgi:AcrR family transcriptional regulator